MAGAKERIDFKYDDRRVLRLLRELQQRGADMQPIFADMGEYLVRSTQQRFAAQQAPDGTPWEQLSEETIRRKMLRGVKRQKGKSRRSLTTSHGNTKAGAMGALVNQLILVDSGDLRDTIRYQADSAKLQVGSDRIYAATHQFGDEERHIPARPFLGLSDADRAEVIEILRDHLREVLSS